MLNYPLVLFDGVCNLCNGTVDFIIKRKNKTPFLFVALQSEAGKKLAERYHIPPDIDSVILINNNNVFIESEAVLEIARLLPNPWKLATVFRIIPKKWRDNIYKWMAKNRYGWFGKKTFCRLPAPEEKIWFPEVSDLNL
ncbi:MAG TPA: DCC1-like thiol-disulfide oxidoreductase family protein [Draconibacterium sp.]|nr:DCC1-like thiol-disulfide oxidoreductase family protein [Draconibacterium sp.]